MTDQQIMHTAIMYGIGTMPVLNGSSASKIPENERIVRFVRACLDEDRVKRKSWNDPDLPQGQWSDERIQMEVARQQGQFQALGKNSK